MNGRLAGIWAVRWHPKGALDVCDLERAMGETRRVLEDPTRRAAGDYWVIVDLAEDMSEAREIEREWKRKFGWSRKTG